MNWQDIKRVICEIDADNTRTGIEVSVKLSMRGIEIKCETSCGFFKRNVERVIPYGEADHAVHLPGMIHATANEVRAVMMRDLGRKPEVKFETMQPGGNPINSTFRQGGY